MSLRFFVLRVVGWIGSAKLLLEPMIHGREMVPRLPVHGARALHPDDYAETILNAGEDVGQFGVDHFRTGSGKRAGGSFKRAHGLWLRFAPARSVANADANASARYALFLVCRSDQHRAQQCDVLDAASK